MNPICKFLGISVSSVTTVTAFAASQMVLDNAKLSEVKNHFSITGPGLSAGANQNLNSLRLVRQRQDNRQVTHIRMQQYYAGFPVFGGYGIFHTKQAMSALIQTSDKVSMNGLLFSSLDKDLGQPPEHFAQNAQQALTHFKKNYRKEEIREEDVFPMVYINEKQQAVWAYQVSLFVEHQDAISSRPTAILDAKTHEILEEWNEIKTIRQKVQGVGYGGNESFKKYLYGSDLPYLSFERDMDLGECYFENEGVRVVDMEHSHSKRNKPLSFPCPSTTPDWPNAYWTGYYSDGYDLGNGAYSPMNDALYAGDVINKMYQEWFNVPALAYRGKPMQLVMRIHYGRGYENAFWDGRQMTFGDGEALMHPLVSLGIGAHEISHGFTEQHSNLIYRGQSGGMNEAFSDMAAQAAEYYSWHENSWNVGADVLKKNSGYKALRFMQRPSLDGYSIDHAGQYYRGLDVHYSSGVYNRMFYLLATTPGWNTKKAFSVMVKANMDYWTPYSSFDQGGCGILNAAKDLGYSITDVKYSLTEVGVSIESCSKALL